MLPPGLLLISHSSLEYFLLRRIQVKIILRLGVIPSREPEVLDDVMRVVLVGLHNFVRHLGELGLDCIVRLVDYVHIAYLTDLLRGIFLLFAGGGDEGRQLERGLPGDFRFSLERHLILVKILL